MNLKGNKYFENDLLRERLKVQKADAYLRSGRYSSALVTQDVAAIQSLYRANGFDEAKVTPEVKDIDESPGGKALKTGEIEVMYTIVEGPQQKFGTVKLAGVDSSRTKAVTGLLNAQPGQPFSLITLSGDRDAVLTYYLSHGFDQVKVEVKQIKENGDADKTDVTLNVDEGQQVSVDRVLLSGLDRTRPSTVDSLIKVHAGDPLNQSALLDTQRNLYNLALFNEVVAAVQNPEGDAPQQECAAATDGGEALGRDVRLWIRGGDGDALVGSDFAGVGDSAGAGSECGVSAERQDGCEPASVTGREPDQSARNGQVDDAAFVVWIAGRGCDC